MRMLTSLATTCAVVLSLGAGGASAAIPRTVRLGSAPARPHGARVLGSFSATSKLDLTVALQPSDPVALEAYAEAVSNPSSSLYRHYLTVAEFARRFGPSSASIDAVRRSLVAHGLAVGALSANHLSLAVASPAGTVASAFSTSFQRLTLRSGRTAFTNTSAPQLDSSIANDVQAIVGLDTIAQPQPLALTRSSAPTSRFRAESSAANSSNAAPVACSGASSALSEDGNQGALTADQVASAYDFDGLYSEGDEGAGVTVALYELEGNFASDITAYQTCFGATGTVSYDHVDGGAPTASAANQDGIETELDAENVIGLAPKANVIIYQAPPTDQGAIDNYEAMISQDKAQVISTSWGDCESDLGTSDADAENTLFEEAATQGQTVVAASGDDGAQDCNEVSASDLSTSVDDPASQPFVTGVGGTTLLSTSPLSETVWNNGPNGAGAGGGGDSSLWKTPSYQSGAASSLHVINSQSSSSDCSASTGTYCREVPDVSADADPNSGYLIYWDGSGSDSDSDAWISVGGTSGSAPLWAALFALADDTSSCAGTGVGFANSDLYRAATNNYSAYFNDVTSGNNDWLGVNGGEYAAGAGYDQASGLGTPIASSLAPALCGSTLALSEPATQNATVGSATSLQLTSTDRAAGKTVTYGAANLPLGLSINASTGLISGTPTTQGTYTVTISALDTAGNTASQTFSWVVAAAGTSTTTTPTTTTTTPTSTTPTTTTTTTTPTTTTPTTTTPTSTTPTSTTPTTTTTTPTTPTTTTPTTTTLGTVTLAGVAAQSGRIDRSTSLQLLAVNSTSGAIGYLAAGVPPGLTLDDYTGRIAGTPTQAGIYLVTLEAAAVGSTPDIERFTWTIGGWPTISHATLHGVAKGSPSLAFQLGSGLDAPALKELTVRLPSGLTSTTAHSALKKGISLRSASGSKVSFTASVSHGQVIIKPGQAIASAEVTIAAPALRAGSGLIARVAGGRDSGVSLTVTTADSTGLSAKLSAVLRPS